jgi:poly-gamma-glutamate synthesis protein (capsule biosynthesis protein)
LGILSFADRHFSEWDAELKQGVNPVYLPKIIRDIFNLKARCDHVIVILHNGVEMYPYPTPRNQDLCRLLIEQGASIVMCQHSHVAGCCEKHKGGTIIYGQGNLIFPSNTNEEAWWSGMLVSITIDRSNKLDVEFVPYMRSRDNSCFLLDKARDDVYDEFIKRSEAIKQLGFLDEKWREFVQSHLKEKIFHSIFDGRSFRSRWSLWFSRQLMRIFPNFKMSQSKTLWWLHHMRSDDERELMESILRSNLKGHN